MQIFSTHFKTNASISIHLRLFQNRLVNNNETEEKIVELRQKMSKLSVGKTLSFYLGEENVQKFFGLFNLPLINLMTTSHLMLQMDIEETLVWILDCMKILTN